MSGTLSKAFRVRSRDFFSSRYGDFLEIVSAKLLSYFHFLLIVYCQNLSVHCKHLDVSWKRAKMENDNEILSRCRKLQKPTPHLSTLTNEAFPSQSSNGSKCPSSRQDLTHTVRTALEGDPAPFPLEDIVMCG